MKRSRQARIQALVTEGLVASGNVKMKTSDKGLVDWWAAIEREFERRYPRFEIVFDEVDGEDVIFGIEGPDVASKISASDIDDIARKVAPRGRGRGADSRQTTWSREDSTDDYMAMTWG